MDYIRSLGPLVLDHRFKRLMEMLLGAAEDVYEGVGLTFRARWASTYRLLHLEGPLGIMEIADRLRMTHPGVIGITDDMAQAGIVTPVRDRADARRRLIAITPKGRAIAAQLFRIWTELARAQRERFAATGCDIMSVIDTVEDGLASQNLAEEVLHRLHHPAPAATPRAKAPSRRSPAKAHPAKKHVAHAARMVALVLLASSVTACVTRRVVAQDSATTMEARQRTDLVRAISDSLIAGYIYEPKARILADSLLTAAKAGTFDDVRDEGAFAVRLNEFLLRLSNDRHLRITHSASGTAVNRRQPIRRRAASIPDTEGQALGPARDFGFARAQVLEGNVGYLDLLGFPDSPEALRLADSAMAMFANVDALIIDLRRNRGGGPEMVRHISTYLFDKPTHLVSTFSRGMAAPAERWTVEHVAGKRLGKVPVYLLTSPQTFSAAESFAFGLKVNGRVTIVGEKTGGGGHWGRVIPLTDGFSMFLPVGRSYDPRTNLGWEATGIAPDVVVPSAEALDRALKIIRRLTS